MKKLLSPLIIIALSTMPCHAQFGTLSRIYKGVKAAKEAKKSHEEQGSQKGNDPYQGYSIDTTSVEYKKALEEAQKRIKELGASDIDYNSKDYQDAYTKAQKMYGLAEDPIFKKAMEEQRQLTMEEATYLNEKYGTTFGDSEMDSYTDSVGVFAHLKGSMKPMCITKYKKISDERPIPNFGQDAIKQYVQSWLSLLKRPFADKEIVDSVQNYAIYDNRHAEEQFKETAQFTLYSNLELKPELTAYDLHQRRVADFTEPIDPKNIFVFKVQKGVDCRYMEFMYTKISYKQSELHNYITNRLVKEGYIDANINQKQSDDELFRAIDKMEFQFKVEKLLKMRQNNEKYMYANTVPVASGARISSNTRKVGNVTALDVTINAEPGEYAFLIRNPEVDEYFKQMAKDEKDEQWSKRLEGFDVSILTQGAFFFTIK